MRCIKRIVPMLISAVVVTGCHPSVAPQLPFDNVIKVESFPQTYSIGNGEVLNVNKIGITDIMLCDSLLLVSTLNPSGYLSALNLKTGVCSQDVLKQGNAKGELLYNPYFSDFDQVNHNGRTALLLNDQKGNMLQFYPEDLFDEKYPEITVANDSIPLVLFCCLYVNDSTYMCRRISKDASRQIRYLLVNGKKQTTESMKKLNDLAIPVKGDGYMFNILSTFSKYCPSRELFVEASLMLNMIHLYSLDGSVEKTIVYGKRPDSIDDVFYAGMRKLKSNFTGLQVYDDFFAVMYSGAGEYDEEKNKPLPKIFFFYWDGSPIVEIRMGEQASTFDLDVQNGVLYTLDRSTETVRYYDVKEILDKASLTLQSR